MNVNYFTIYWRHGQRQVVEGETVDEAFKNAGIGAGAIAAVDWYDNGITDTHVFEAQGVWTKKKKIVFQSSEFNSMPSLENIAQLTEQLKTAHNISVVFPSKDVLEIYKRWHHFNVGWTEVIVIHYGEYFDHPYSEDSEEDHHYMVTNTEYHDPEYPDRAVKAFLKRYNDGPFNPSGCISANIQELCEKQGFVKK